MAADNNIVKFDNKDLNTIKENVHTIYNKVLNTPFKQIFIRNVYKVIAYTILSLGVIAMLIGIFLASTALVEKRSKTLYLLVIIIGVILIIAGSVLIIVGQSLAKKIKQEFLTHSVNYLKMAVAATFNAVVISNIDSNFTIMPQKFLVMGGGANHRVWTEKVIIGSINEKDFNCGTTLERIVTTYKVGKETITNTTYNRYLYFTCLIEMKDITTTIVPETLISKIMGSNRGDQLESAAFEKLFALDYSDPIKLRKLLVPKVMSKMVDLANAQAIVPRIYVNKDQVTLMFPYMNIGDGNNAAGNLMNLIIGDNEEQLLANVLEMLNLTLDMIIKAYEWIVSLDLAQQMVFK